MKSIFWLFLILFVLGFFGTLTNLFTGFSLTRTTASEADFHLTVALIAVALLCIGGLGLIQISNKMILTLQEKILLSNGKGVKNLDLLSSIRSSSVSATIFVIVCCIINLISGTISQSGRFPIVHGIFGFILIGLTIAALVFWIRLGFRLAAAEK